MTKTSKPPIDPVLQAIIDRFAFRRKRAVDEHMKRKPAYIPHGLAAWRNAEFARLRAQQTPTSPRIAGLFKVTAKIIAAVYPKGEAPKGYLPGISRRIANRRIEIKNAKHDR